MTFYSPAQILGNGKVRKTRMRRQLRTRVSSASFQFDVQFLKALGKVWIVVFPCLFLFYSVTSAMVSNIAESVTSVENMNYQLLTINLDLRSKTKIASSAEVVQERAASLGLYKHERGQLRVYKVNKNYFSYQ